MKLALSMGVIFGFGAIAIDLGWARLVRAQLEVAAEAASHAGAAQLDGTDVGLANARNVAIAVGNVHKAGGGFVALTSADVETGIYDAGAFTPSTVAEDVNAVRVSASIPDLGLFFAPFAFGQEDVSVGARSIAIVENGGATELECFLPLAIPQCLLDTGLDEAGGVTLQVNPPSADNMAWARPEGSPSASWTVDQLENCGFEGEVGIGSDVGLQNGAVIPAISEIVDQISTSTTSWPPEMGPRPDQQIGSAVPAADYGKTLEGPVMVFDAGPEFCDGGSAFNGTQVITGFAWVVIYDVKNSGSMENRSIYAQVDTVREHEYGTQGGGQEWGVTGQEPPRFVASN